MSNFNRNSIIYIVRISSKTKTAQNDYNIFLNQIRHNQDPIWDNTKNNSIQVSDYFGFIVGIGGNEEVKLHKVNRVGNASHATLVAFFFFFFLPPLRRNISPPEPLCAENEKLYRETYFGYEEVPKE